MGKSIEDRLTASSFTDYALYNVSSSDRVIQTQIESYNIFADELPTLIMEQFKQDRLEDLPSARDGVSRIGYGLRFTNVSLKSPTITHEGNDRRFYPRDVKNKNRTYESSIYADVVMYIQPYTKNGSEYVAGEKNEVIIERRLLGCIPIMVKSKLCNLYRQPDEVLRALGEDPAELGGYFIIDGSDKILVPRKNNIKNAPILTRTNDGVLECKLTSQYGSGYHEQSKFMVIRMYQNNAVTISITLGKDFVLTIPAFILFYLFGMEQDMDIYDAILPDKTNDSKFIMMSTKFTDMMRFPYTSMKPTISRANMFHKYDKKIRDNMSLCIILAEVLNSLDKSAQKVEYRLNNEEARMYSVGKINDLLNTSIFPHIGKTIGDRHDKLLYLGSLIHRLYGISLGDSITDRNSLEYTPIHGPSAGLIGTLKAVVNMTNVNPIITKIQQAVRKSNKVDLVRLYNKEHKPDFLGTTMNKFIKAGNKPKIVIKKDSVITNRTNTVQRDNTNRSSEISTLRGVTNNPNSMGGKSNEPILASRSVHATHTGYLCHMQTVEGEATGLSTHMAISAEIAEVTPLGDLRERIEKDIEFSKNNYDPNDGFHSEVYLDGVPMGLYYDTRILCRKYRTLRLQGDIHFKVTVEYQPLNNGNLYISTHLGRFTRPLIKVYKILEKWQEETSTWQLATESDRVISSDFAKTDKQWIKFNSIHAKQFASGTTSYLKLIDEGVIEYISPREMKNCIVADSWDTFYANRNDPLCEYTHIDVPIATMSLSILTTPYGNNSQPIRAVYAAKFTKQSCGDASNMYGIQFNSKVPIRCNNYRSSVKTVTDDIVTYGKTTCIIAVSAEGKNIEDSIICSDRLIEHNKYTVEQFSSINIELETSQSFATPDPQTVKGTKNMDYSAYLVDGLPKIGTVIHKDMAIIGIIEINSADKTKEDRSRYHYSDYPITIVNVIDDYNHSATRIVKVSYKMHIPTEPGDKYGSGEGCKGVLSKAKRAEEMMVTETGLIPELIINPHTFPSRMVINQIMEGAMGEIATKLGITIDATMFKDFDENKLDELSKKLGLGAKYIGKQVMYDGVTGKKVDAKIAILYNGYERLTKMAKDQSSASNTSHIDIRTQQPKKGVAKGGAMRVGFMEGDTMLAHGGGNVMTYIMHKEVDGKDIYICNRCNGIASANPKRKIFICNDKECRVKGTTFTKVRTAHGTIRLNSYLNPMGVKMDIIPEPITI